MKTKHIVQSAFSAAISSSLLVSPVAAHTDFWDDFMANSLLNVTQGGTIKYGNGRIFYTTSVYFRFGPAFEQYEPIIEFSPPKTSFGCGGLSIKGMFIKILGLDRLSLMLKSAGASLAWGIAIGLIYSLPGVSASFSFLNNWAKKIQQLLQNACQSGFNIGRHMAKKVPGLDGNKIFQDAFDSFIQEPVNSLDNYVKTKAKAWGISDMFDNNMVFTFGDDTSISKTDQERLYRSALVNHFIVPSIKGNLIAKYLKEIGKSQEKINKFIKAIYGHNIADIKPFDARIIAITYNYSASTGAHVARTFSLEEIVNDYGILSPSKKEAIAHDFFATALVLSAGNSVTVKAKNKVLDDLQSAYASVSHSGSVNGDGVKKMISDIINGKIAIIQSGISAPTANPNNLGSAIANYFWFGTTNPAGLSALTEMQKVPAIAFIVIPLPDYDDPDNKNKKDFVFLPIGLTESQVNFFDVSRMQNEKGAFERSKELIKKFVEGTATDTDMAQTVFLVPDIFDKIRIIQDSPRMRQGVLIDALAQYNAYQSIKQAFSGVLELAGINSFEIPAIHVNYNTSGDSQTHLMSRGNVNSNDLIDRMDTYRDVVSSFQDSTVKLYNAMMKRLNEIPMNNDFVKSPYKLEKMFQEQDLQNKRNAVKNLK